MFTRLKAHFARFSDDTSGTVAVEVAVVLPLLLWAYIAMFVFFDAFQTRSATEKAAFTVSDMLSRETNAINDDYMSGAYSLFNLLAKSDATSGLRVSMISWNLTDSKYVLNWSKTKGNIAAYVASDIDTIKADLPTMIDGETLILVETRTTFNPSLQVGIGNTTLETFIFTRPRFAPQLVWSNG